MHCSFITFCTGMLRNIIFLDGSCPLARQVARLQAAIPSL